MCYFKKSKKKNNEIIVENDIIKTFEESILSVGIGLLPDYAEIGIDLLCQDGSVLEQIPFVKSVFAVGKALVCIRDKMLCIKVINFIKEFNSGTMNKDALEKHKRKLNNKNMLKREYETVMQILDLSTNALQARLSARFYLAYIYEKITFDDFAELAEANRRIFIKDLALINRIKTAERLTEISAKDDASINRLLGLGMVIDERIHNPNAVLAISDDEKNHKDGVVFTEFGKIYAEFIDADICNTI